MFQIGETMGATGPNGSNRKGRVPNLEKCPELAQKIVELISKGMTQGHAAEMVGIHQSTFYDWFARGEKAGAKECFREFNEAIKRARIGFLTSHLDNITAQSKRNWTCSAWLLERVHPDKYASAETQTRSRLEEIEREVQALHQLAIQKGILDKEGTTDAMQPAKEG